MIHWSRSIDFRSRLLFTYFMKAWRTIVTLMTVLNFNNNITNARKPQKKL